MQYTTIALFALAGFASAATPPDASNSTSPAAGPSATCDAAYSSCQSQPGANQATCYAQYSTCLGYDPAASASSAAAAAAVTTSPSGGLYAGLSTPAGNKAYCDAQYSGCRSQQNANQATCAAQYSGCLGYNPFAPNGTNTATSAVGPAQMITVVTDVVTAYTTFCPYATQVTQNGVVYTATASQTLTITNCPCTVTKSVSQQTGSMTPSSASIKSTAAANATTTYKPAVFTGAANQLAAGGSLLAVGAAAVLLF